MPIAGLLAHGFAAGGRVAFHPLQELATLLGTGGHCFYILQKCGTQLSAQFFEKRADLAEHEKHFPGKEGSTNKSALTAPCTTIDAAISQ